ncbi:MAG TPA: hypothetical protein VMB84_18935 [Stellaceae bacterium]|nr:hypothetical protein [Stellaceae bacterium]
MSVSDTAAYTTRGGRLARHVSFLAYDNFRYLKIALAAVVVATVLYIAVVPYAGRYGGGWAGYTLGTVGALLILWLTWFGYRKRTYNPERKYVHGHGEAAAAAEAHPEEDPSRLARRLSAHVYLGLALLVIATLHTAFHFGWNIHTLAYTLMCIVIFSGIYGVFAYAHYPRLMTDNRENLTMGQMLARIVAVDAELRRAALPLDDATAAAIRGAVENTPVGGSMWRQASGRYPSCGTARALAFVGARGGALAKLDDEAWRQLRAKLEEKSIIVAQLRRDVRYKALMDVWLYFHVPLTFALIAALSAHIISIFFL